MDRSNRYWILAILWSLLLYSCMNRYEKKLVGNYEIARYERMDSLSHAEIELPILKLNNNKSFVLTFKSRNIKGKWQANDYGDFTLIEFLEGDKQAQGKMIGTEVQPEIEISIPANFYCPFLKTLVFKQKQ